MIAKMHAIERDMSDKIELRDPQSCRSETDQRSSAILTTLDEIEMAVCKLEDQTQLQPSSKSNESVSQRCFPWIMPIFNAFDLSPYTGAGEGKFKIRNYSRLASDASRS